MPYGVKTGSDILQKAQEGLTGYLGVIQSDHAYIHDGIGYAALITSASIAAGADYKIQFTTPGENSGKFIHFRPVHLTTTANVTRVRMYEDSTSISGGTAVTIYNHNRLSTNVSGVTINQGVTATNGNALPVGTVAGTDGNTASRTGGGTDGSAEEWVLKQGTEYTFMISNVGSTTATVADLILFWYEELKGIDNGG
jgi:hypothetical protein